MELERVVRLTFEGIAARVEFCNVKDGNPVTSKFIQELKEVFDTILENGECRVVILAAKGEFFCSGMQFSSSSNETLLTQIKRDELIQYQRLLNLVLTFRLPVIACIEGSVIGGGVGLVCVCDIVLAKENIIFQLPEVLWGFLPSVIAPYLLHRISPARLKYLALSATSVFARDAAMFGLVDEVVGSDLPKILSAIICRMSKLSSVASEGVKTYVNLLVPLDEKERTDLASKMAYEWANQPDHLLRVKRFMDGFAPWTTDEDK